MSSPLAPECRRAQFSDVAICVGEKERGEDLSNFNEIMQNLIRIMI